MVRIFWVIRIVLATILTAIAILLHIVVLFLKKLICEICLLSRLLIGKGFERAVQEEA